MAKKKEPTPKEEKFEDTDLNIFDVLSAADRKDYGFFDRLSDEQQKKLAFFTLIQWMSSVTGKKELQQYYIMSTNMNANTHLFDEKLRNHAKLQWLQLCASSPGIGTLRHQWIPQLSSRITGLKDAVDRATVKKYFSNVYYGMPDSTISELTEAYIEEHKKKYYLSQNFPMLKLADIEALSNFITEEDIKAHERAKGNE